MGAFGHGFAKFDYVKYCKENFGDKPIPQECTAKSIAPRFWTKSYSDMQQVTADMVFEETTFEIFKTLLTAEVATIEGIRNCLVAESTGQLSRTIEPKWCNNEKKRQKDGFGNNAISCCSTNLNSLHKLMPRSAIANRLNKALNNLSWPENLDLKLPQSRVRLLAELDSRPLEPKLTAAEKQIARSIIDDKFTELAFKMHGRENAEDEYQAFRKKMISEAEWYDKNSDIVASMQPPNYKANSQQMIEVFNQRIKTLNSSLRLFRTRGQDSNIINCVMSKFPYTIIGILNSMVSRSHDLSYCQSASNFTERCSKYENDVFTKAAPFLTIGGVTLTLASSFLSPLFAAGLVGSGMLMNTTASISTLRDESIYQINEGFSNFGGYQGDFEPFLKRFLNIGSSIPLPIPALHGSSYLGKVVGGTIENAQPIKGILAGQLNDVEQTLDDSFKLSQANERAKEQIENTSDQFQESHLPLPTDQVYYAITLQSKIAKTSYAASAVWQKHFNDCIKGKTNASMTINDAIQACRD
jgi:hypothetical protein